MRAFLAKLVIEGAVKCDHWSVTNHYIHPKHATHLAIVLDATVLLAFSHGCNQVYELRSFFNNMSYFRLPPSGGHMYKKSARATLLVLFT